MYNQNNAAHRAYVNKSAYKRVRDTFKASGFAFNEHGFIRSDFADLMDANSVTQMASALSRLRELQVQKDPTLLKAKTFEEKVALVVPRWIDTPAKMDRFEQFILDQKIADLQDIQSEIEEARKKRMDKEAYEKTVLDAAGKLSSPEASVEN